MQPRTPYCILLSLAYSALTKADSMSHQLYKNLIGGEWVASRTGKTFLNINPANSDDIVGEFQSSAAEDIDDAVRAAAEAWKAWRLTPAPKRAEIIFKT